MKIEDLYHIYKECGAISTDSRKLVHGSLFFALKGDNFDGNRFAAEALEKGCAYAVVDDPSLFKTSHPLPSKTLYVPDVLECLQNLAAFHRSQLDIPFIGITGSNGKTTTKELMAAVLSRKYKVCATQGNLNNHIGVPLTILSVKDHEIAIVEMGANHIGEIAVLSRIADPGYGIITNIGKAHLEGFGSPEGVIRAKSELYDYLASRNAKAFVDSANPLLCSLAKTRNLDTEFYGNPENSSCYGEITDNSSFLKAIIYFPAHSEKLDISTSMVGDFNLNNMLAAACIGDYFGVLPGKIAEALSEYVPSNSRSQMLETSKNKIVLDAYNANPSSMHISIKNFLSMKGDKPKLIILGDMLELGDYSGPEHQSVIDLVTDDSSAGLILVGEEFCTLSKGSSIPGFRKVEDLIEHLRLNPVNDHSILLKGSRGIRLERLVDFL